MSSLLRRLAWVWLLATAGSLPALAATPAPAPATAPATAPAPAPATTTTTTTTNRWEREIAALEVRGRAIPPGSDLVVLYGSSSFRMWTNAGAALAPHRVVNFGFGGSQFSDLIDFVDRVVVPLRPGLVLLYGGDNDLAAGKSPEVVEADFRRLMERIRTALPATRIGCLAVKPSPSRSKLLPAQQDANQRLRRVARWHQRVDFLEVATPLLDAEGAPDPRYFASDHLHLNAAGYARWQEVLAPHLGGWRPQAN